MKSSNRSVKLAIRWRRSSKPKWILGSESAIDGAAAERGGLILLDDRDCSNIVAMMGRQMCFKQWWNKHEGEKAVAEKPRIVCLMAVQKISVSGIRKCFARLLIEKQAEAPEQQGRCTVLPAVGACQNRESLAARKSTRLTRSQNAGFPSLLHASFARFCNRTVPSSGRPPPLSRCNIVCIQCASTDSGSDGGRMTTAPPNDYGHAGEAQYNVDHSEWLFTRRLGYNRRLQLFEGPTVTLKSHSAPGISHIPRSARARNHSIRDLTSVFPEVAAAANYLPLQARDSEHVEELYGLHDPHESELLAFGHATETDDSYSHPKRVHVVAIPGGPSKDNLIIVRLNRETFEWQGHEKLRLSSTTLRSGERSMLQSGRGPIRQLRFSPATLGGRAWLAVRFNTETILLQPVFRRNDGLSKPRLPIPSSMVDRRSSRSDSDHSLVLSMHRTGGSSHSDVAFNPFIGNEFAVLDQQGCWSIWKLERQGQRRVGWRMRRVISGHVDSLHTSGKNVTDTLEDGWGRVNWVGDSKTIYVVSRTSLAILGLSNGTGQLPTPSLITAGSTESIIDAKEDPLNTSRFYVVTSTQIFCLEVPSYSDPGHEKFRERARVVICWRHFRDYQDISLRISICRATECE